MVRQLRRDVSIPLAFMTYANVVFSYGSEAFIRACADLGRRADPAGRPLEERDEFAPLCQRYGVDLISLIAPTSADRVDTIARQAQGFLYTVSSLGVTGVRSQIEADVSEWCAGCAPRACPCAVGLASPRRSRRGRWPPRPTGSSSAARSSSWSPSMDGTPRPTWPTVRAMKRAIAQ